MLMILALQAATLTAPPPPPRPRTVEIAGLRYAVTVLRDRRSVTVTGGDRDAPRTTPLADRFRLAADRATGCRMIDSYWVGTMLTGKLDCTSRRIP